jgi:hypothetical protein
MEQKGKAEAEMEKLNDEINKYEQDLIAKNSKISRLQDQVK